MTTLNIYQVASPAPSNVGYESDDSISTMPSPDWLPINLPEVKEEQTERERHHSYYRNTREEGDGDHEYCISNVVYQDIERVYREDRNVIPLSPRGQEEYHTHLLGHTMWDTMEKIGQNERLTTELARRRHWLNLYHAGRVIHELIMDHYKQYPNGYMNLAEAANHLYIPMSKAKVAYRIYKFFREEEHLVTKTSIGFQMVMELTGAEFLLVLDRINDLKERLPRPSYIV